MKQPDFFEEWATREMGFQQAGAPTRSSFHAHAQRSLLKAGVAAYITDRADMFRAFTGREPTQEQMREWEALLFREAPRG